MRYINTLKVSRKGFIPLKTNDLKINDILDYKGKTEI